MSKGSKAVKDLLASMKATERDRLVRALAKALVEEIRESQRLAEARRLDR